MSPDPVAPGQELQTEQAVVDLQVTVVRSRDRGRHHRCHLLRHDADIERVVSDVPVPVQTQAAGRPLQRGDVLLQANVRRDPDICWRRSTPPRMRLSKPPTRPPCEAAFEAALLAALEADAEAALLAALEAALLAAFDAALDAALLAAFDAAFDAAWLAAFDAALARSVGSRLGCCISCGRRRRT